MQARAIFQMEALPDISIGIPPTPASMQDLYKTCEYEQSRKLAKARGKPRALSPVLKPEITTYFLVVVDFF
ncbi:hypothetical protein D584_19688, partial [Brucella intermedia M86]